MQKKVRKAGERSTAPSNRGDKGRLPSLWLCVGHRVSLQEASFLIPSPRPWHTFAMYSPHLPSGNPFLVSMTAACINQLLTREVFSRLSFLLGAAFEVSSSPGSRESAMYYRFSQELQFTKSTFLTFRSMFTYRTPDQDK